MAPADLAFVDSHRDLYHKPVVEYELLQLYPQDSMLTRTRIIGYTGEISEEELDDPQFAKYDPGQVIGKFGIERQYNAWLTGVDGQRQVVVDNRGTVRQELGTKPATPGKDLQLTIDLDLQAVAELSMDSGLHEAPLNVDHKNGAVIALDPNTGEVLAMVSRPTFDPNRFAKDFKKINSNPDHPLLNRAIQDAQAPGSTFKPIMAIAGLETGTIDDQWTVHCPGGATFYGHRISICLKGRPQLIELHRSIVDSCDVYFYSNRHQVGHRQHSLLWRPDRCLANSRRSILPGRRTGVMPSAQWKMRTQRQEVVRGRNDFPLHRTGFLRSRRCSWREPSPDSRLVERGAAVPI